MREEIDRAIRSFRHESQMCECPSCKNGILLANEVERLEKENEELKKEMKEEHECETDGKSSYYKCHWSV